MATWLGALTHGGVIEAALGDSPQEAAGDAVASYVLGAERLAQLKRWFRAAPADEAAAQRRAAVEACLVMAHADHLVQPEERALIERIVADSGLAPEDQRALVASIADAPPPLESLAARLTQPILRELILALSWELALADERVDPAESTLYGQLAEALEVPAERAAELRAAIDERVG